MLDYRPANIFSLGCGPGSKLLNIRILPSKKIQIFAKCMNTKVFKSLYIKTSVSWGASELN